MSAPAHGGSTGAATAPAPVGELLDAARAEHRAGRVRAAADGYRAILATDPDHVDALHLLGVCAVQLDRAEEGLDLIRRAIEGDAERATFHNSLGEAHRARWDPEAAVAAYERAVTLDPAYAEAHCNAGLVLQQIGRTREALLHLGQAIRLRPDDPAAYSYLGDALRRAGHHEEAIPCYEQAVRLRPDLVGARFMLDALTGARPRIAPAEYVARLFDDCADGFDAHLRGRLDYRGPELLRQAVGAVRAEPGRATEPGATGAGGRVLDLGCGTGLCGAAFRDLADHLAGVDLSPRMIAKARERGVYDRLVVGDLRALLDAEPDGGADLVLAGDVFTYVGDLRPIVTACARALRRGGLLAFTVETLTADARTPGSPSSGTASSPGAAPRRAASAHAGEPDAYRLCPTGRYVHDPAALRRTMAGCGFTIAHDESAVLRRQSGNGVQARILVARAGG